jgi:hypothetical protein
MKAKYVRTDYPPAFGWAGVPAVIRNMGLKYFTYYNPKIEDLQPIIGVSSGTNAVLFILPTRSGCWNFQGLEKLEKIQPDSCI